MFIKHNACSSYEYNFIHWCWNCFVIN
uniref:Uncharacterized protein n=1 Tax=Anguilla anguilla TaxID=7936 RepID=A0A0E9U4R4_ANGAN